MSPAARRDATWAAAHPLRWARTAWPHWAIALLLLVKAVLIADPIWAQVPLTGLWPPLLGGVAFMVVASAVTPRSSRLATATGVVLGAVAAGRAVTYMLLTVASPMPTVRMLAFAFAVHWLLLAAMASRFTAITLHTALQVVVERADEGRDRGDGDR